MKPSERLLVKLRELPGLEIPEDARLVRAPGSHAGRYRNRGAWCWTVADADGIPLHRDSHGRPMAIGSHFTMGDLLRWGVQANRDLGGDINIDPPDEVQRRWAGEEKGSQ